MKYVLLVVMLFISQAHSAQIKPASGYAVEPLCNFNTICLKNEIWELRNSSDYANIQKIVAKYARYNQGWLNRLDHVMGGVVVFTVHRQDYGRIEVLLEKKGDSWVVIKESNIIF